ncbi:MAG: hypothetical protein V3T30_04985 [Thermodesulfobacteriota bacterium]
MKKTLLLLVILLFLSTAALAKEPLKWTAQERAWLTALTSEDSAYDPKDFGKKPSARARALLNRLKPRIIVSPDGLLPVDFYKFYLPNTAVRDLKKDGKSIWRGPGRDYLKKIERDRRFYLDYAGPFYPCTDCKGYVAPIYATLYEEVAELRDPDGKPRKEPIVILKYNLAFPFSGLPAKLNEIKEAAINIAIDPRRWHELDIHGSVQIILNKMGRPMVLLLAQHNHFRSYVIGKDIAWPKDGHIPICFAERSNEPYPCDDKEEPALHRAVSDPTNAAYLIDGRNEPLISGFDKVYSYNSGGREIKTRAEFLPSLDPLYVSWIPLGDRQSVLGFGKFYRKGPPGMSLTSLPELKRYGDIMQFWYLRDGSIDDAELMKKSFRSFTDVDFEAVLNKNGARLRRTLKEAGFIK